MSLGWRPRAGTPGSQSAQNRPIHLGSDALASCESQTHVYNDTPLDGGTQQTGQETKRTDARPGALCILCESQFAYFAEAQIAPGMTGAFPTTAIPQTSRER